MNIDARTARRISVCGGTPLATGSRSSGTFSSEHMSGLGTRGSGLGARDSGFSTRARPLNILGIWDGHDSGAALLQDGQLRCAINEERLSRRKLEVCFPARSIAACLALAQLSPEQVQLV